MNLITINLLPYREIEEARQKRRFNIIMGMGFAAGAGLCIAAYLGLTGLIKTQESRNESLQAGIAILDKDLAEIKELQKQKQNFLARKLKVEELDNKRFEGARIIDTLNQLVPDGVYLISINSAGKQSGAIDLNYTLIGKAVSDDKVGKFMDALPSTGVFELPQLVSIKKTDNGQEFTLTAKLVEQKIASAPEEPKTASSAGKP